MTRCLTPWLPCTVVRAVQCGKHWQQVENTRKHKYWQAENTKQHKQEQAVKNTTKQSTKNGNINWKPKSVTSSWKHNYTKRKVPLTRRSKVGGKVEEKKQNKWKSPRYVWLLKEALDKNVWLGGFGEVALPLGGQQPGSQVCCSSFVTQGFQTQKRGTLST